jgi:hypothetical protein
MASGLRTLTSAAQRRKRSASGSGVLHGKGKKPKPPKKPQRGRATGSGTLRQWSPGADVACCSAEAFGTLVEASGAPWSAEQTLALYWSTASHPDAGASILATLRAAGSPACEWPAGVTPGAPLILGVALPESHAVAVTPDGRWWSWGEPFNPGDWPELEIDEAWAVLL